MEKIILSPSKYVQGPDMLNNMAKYTSKLGNKVLVIADDFIMNLVKEKMQINYNENNAEVHFEKFNGECSREEIDILIEIVKNKNINCIAGVGGGKTLDTAKATSFYTKLPIVVAPTIASTDAPCSALSVIYTPEGVFSEYLFLPKNPDLVIMDTIFLNK